MSPLLLLLQIAEETAQATNAQAGGQEITVMVGLTAAIVGGITLIIRDGVPIVLKFIKAKTEARIKSVESKAKVDEAEDARKVQDQQLTSEAQAFLNNIAKAQYDEQRTKIHDLEDRVGDGELVITELKNQLNHALTQLSENKIRLESQGEDLVECQKQVRATEKELDLTTKKLHEAEERVEELQTQMGAVQAQLLDTRAAANLLEIQLGAEKGLNVDLKAQLNQTLSELSLSQKRVETLTDDNRKLEKLLYDAKLKLALKGKISTDDLNLAIGDKPSPESE